MVKVQILGIGCPKCKQLTANAALALKELGMDTAVEKVTDVKAIMNYGVMTTPALVVNGQVKLVGKVASVREIKDMLRI